VSVAVAGRAGVGVDDADEVAHEDDLVSVVKVTTVDEVAPGVDVDVAGVEGVVTPASAIEPVEDVGVVF
jgi:hypothetical protein